MKKFLSVLLFVCIVFTSLSPVFAADFDKDLWTDTYLVMDMTTGDILAQSNINERMYPASLTKMMTAVLVYEYFAKQGSLQLTVSADEEAVDVEPTVFGLKYGETMTVDEALNIMLVMSANDIAVMLAKAVGGTTEHFARLMNQKAEELGMENTHFVTPNGLHDNDHYSTASDLAKLALYLLDNEYLAAIVAQDHYDYDATDRHSSGTVNSTNLLYSNDYSIYVGSSRISTKYTRGRVFGVKTGTTPEAGGCFITAVENGDTRILVVILNSRSSDSYLLERFSDAHRLLDWAFDNYRTGIVIDEGESYGTIKVKRGEFNKVRTRLASDVETTVPLDAGDGYITTEYVLDESVNAPFEEGTVVGTLSVYRGGVKFGEYDIVTASAVAKGGILSVFGIEDSAAKKIFKTIGRILLVILLLFLALLCVRVYNKRRIRKKKLEKARRKARAEAERKAREEKGEEPEVQYYYEKE